MGRLLYANASQPTGVVGTAPDSGAFYDLLPTAGSTVDTATNTANGPLSPPSAGTHCTYSAGGTPMTFVSPPVQAFTLCGDVTFYAQAKESSAYANVGRFWARVGRLSSDGTLTWAGSYTTTAEVSTSITQYSNSGAVLTPTELAFADGDRIVLEYYICDSTSNAVTGYTYTLELHNYTGVQFSESVRFLTEAPVTRFYLPSSGTSPLPSLAVSTFWQGVASTFFRAPTFTGKTNTALTNFAARFNSTSSASTCWAQWASPPIPAAYDFSGGGIIREADIVVAGLEDNVQVDGHLAYMIRGFSGDGATDRGTIYFKLSNSTEFTSSRQTRALRIQNAASIALSAGDRIVIEIGGYGVTPSTSYDMTLRFGDPTGVADFVPLSALTTDLCPWFECGPDLFGLGVPASHQFIRNTW